MLSSLIGLSSVLACSLAASSLAAPAEWSPNGQWLAYTLVDAESAPILRDGWLLAGDASSPKDSAEACPRAGAKHRIWATKVGDQESVLIEESSQPLSAPAWGPDGRSLAFGRFTTAGAADQTLVRGRYELVVQSGLDQKRSIVVAPELELEADQRAAIVGMRPEISPDGRFAAVPRPGKSPAVVIVQLDQGAVVKTIEGARRPSWAPDGLRLLFVLESESKPGEAVRTLYVLNRDMGSARPVKADVVLLDAPPIWNLDGQSILAVAQPAPAPMRNIQVDLVRISLEAGPVIRMITLEMLPTAAQRGRMTRFTIRRAGPGVPPVPTPTPPVPFTGRPTVLRSVVSLDREQEQCVALIEIAGQEQAIRWCNVRSQSTAKRIDPIDHGVRIAAPSISPDGQTVAFRIEAPGLPNLPAYCDLTTEAVTLIAPDAPSRRVWLELLATSSAEVLRTLPQGLDAAKSRATILPTASDLAGNAQGQFRLRRMAKIARGLLAQPSPEADDEAELRMFFDYLGGDFAAAGDRLDAVEARSADPDARLRWLCLRAQILIGRGDLDRARGITEYVARSTRPQSYTFEDTPLGPASTAIPNPAGGWSRDLSRALDDATSRRSRSRTAANPDDGDEGETIPSGVWEGLDGRVIDARPRFPFAPDDDGGDADDDGFDPSRLGGRIHVVPPQPRFVDPPSRPVAPPPAPRL